ncbi:Legumain [Fasciola hepatica]|uniref:Legumain n=1 Tax=Fasciola hepatica TaxID=6192 RepID=A0A4E0R0X1_FASHE|nr:Legumain [Fasciola hepatica]
MHFYLLILSLLSSIALSLEGGGGKHWAVLVAGSRGWYNYRHQADVCHAYHVLRKNGIPRENIITMMYDDVAYHRRNPFPGKLFNDYQHKDVYEGVKIDYRGTHRDHLSNWSVLEQIFAVTLAVKDSHVMYYGDSLNASELNEPLASMNRAKRYRKMVLYIEACYSGSMFERILPENIQIFAATAADPTESSWATFCADFDIDTCLADEFSYQWMTDTEKKVALQSVAEFQANGTRRISTGFTGDRVPEFAKHLEKLDHLCEQGYDASVITQAIFIACE